MIVSQRKRKAFFIYSVQGFIDGMKNMKGAYQDKKS